VDVAIPDYIICFCRFPIAGIGKKALFLKINDTISRTFLRKLPYGYASTFSIKTKTQGLYQ